jgi:hypothetical protein
LDCGAADISCAKKTEKALLDYMSSVDVVADADTPALPNPNIELSNRSKRRRLDNSYERTGNDDGRNNGDPGERSVAGDGDPGERSVTGDGDPGERSVAGDGDPAESIKLITKKIRRGINERATQVRKEMKARKRQAVSTEIAPLNTTAIQSENPQAQYAMLSEIIGTRSTEIAPLSITTIQSENPQATLSESLGVLIKTIWDKANELLRVSADIAWKYLFICSCLRMLHGVIHDNKAVMRWLNAARVINLIVDGLWQYWGPHALFVYEALAGKVNSPLERQLLTHKQQRTIFWEVWHVRAKGRGEMLQSPLSITSVKISCLLNFERLRRFILLLLLALC